MSARVRLASIESVGRHVCCDGCSGGVCIFRRGLGNRFGWQRVVGFIRFGSGRDGKRNEDLFEDFG